MGLVPIGVVWYKFVPLETQMVSVTSCSEDGKTNYGASQLQVLRGNSCNTLECLPENEDFKYCNDATVPIITGMTITFEAVAGVTYLHLSCRVIHGMLDFTNYH